MSVEEMKKEAVQKINELHTEEAVREILEYVEKLHSVEEQKKVTAKSVFNEAQEKYDNLLKKLA
jgi:hypothetical protein